MRHNIPVEQENEKSGENLRPRFLQLKHNYQLSIDVDTDMNKVTSQQLDASGAIEGGASSRKPVMSLARAGFAIALPIAVAYQAAAFFFFPWVATTHYLRYMDAFVAGKLGIETLLYAGLVWFLSRTAWQSGKVVAAVLIILLGGTLVAITARRPLALLLASVGY